MNAPQAIAAPAALAKGALRRLAQAQLEPTPENYARAYAEESGQGVLPDSKAETKAQGLAWAGLVERVARNLGRGGKQWTAARRKDSLQRVLDGSRSDPARLLQRLQALMTAWDNDQPSDPAATGVEDPPLAPAVTSSDTAAWNELSGELHATVQVALGDRTADAAALAQRLAALAAALANDGTRPEHVAAIATVCEAARRLLGQGHRLVEQLSQLCRELGAGMGVVAEEDSWVQGQVARLQDSLDAQLSLRGLRAASVLLSETRQQQEQIRAQRKAAREALKELIQSVLQEAGELGEHSGRFHAAASEHAQAIAQAGTLEGLTSVVRALLADTREMQTVAARSRDKLHAERERGGQLQAQVLALEAELRRVSDELTTDMLTQVANRRGLMQAFEAETARVQREGRATEAGGLRLAVGLIDIDNFKRLNDSLGHAAGDVALKSLAAAVKERLRPVDHLARFGGEEFVLLLPGTTLDEAQAALSRLQRSLTEALFLHEGREVFVTFSAGVTAWQDGETLQSALERADAALYEAKRTGKNRTCAA
jgi:diguanylate cyclase